MRTSRIVVLSLVACLSAFISAGAQTSEQEWYDLTDQYLVNADFSKGVNYGIDDVGKVSMGIRTFDGWKADVKPSTSVGGSTFAYGTAVTFNATAIPAVGPDGQGGGACLALCAGLNAEVVFYQEMKMAPGNYKLVVTSMNLNERSQNGDALAGWWKNADENTLSTCSYFPTGEWMNDTICFTIPELTKSRVQVGLRAVGGTTRMTAYLIIDRVQLWRDIPFGPDDEEALLPEVIGDTRFARGATMAFGRIKEVHGDNIAETGYCWATHPKPTIDDNHTTTKLENNGTIYWLKNLQPATIYYMRAYAKTAAGRVGYADDIKFCTVPKGNVTYWYNNGGDEAANKRVNDAATRACEIFNDLSSMVKHFNIGYSAGTPTADCYYGDEPWMNMGANSSYQRAGTIMHEMQHGFGVIPYTTQWNKNILRERLDGEGRGTGHWLGERVSAFLDFWDNTTGSQLNGDYQHMWPYGINGASEDNGRNELYFANAMIGQALGEDGLEHRSNTFSEPCYIFEQEDDVKYYLTNEAVDRGKLTSYLSADEGGRLSWMNVTADDAKNDDHAAWYITFNPAKQYYQLRNAATGQYLSFSGGFKTVVRDTPTANEQLHLMKGRVKVAHGGKAQRGFWLVHPTGTMTPNCMQANANGALGSATFNLANTSTRQRWLILTADELQETTGMEAPTIEQNISKEICIDGIYTLDGRRLNTEKAQLKPGLYIINGRKWVVK